MSKPLAKFIPADSQAHFAKKEEPKEYDDYIKEVYKILEKVDNQIA